MREDGITRRDVCRGAVAMGGGVLLAGTLDPRTAGAVSPPTVHGREAWDAREPRRSPRVLPEGPEHIVVHHTETANGRDYSKSHAFALSRSIQRHHMDHNGWSDIGQQLTISRGGYVLEGRARSLEAIRAREHVVGSHTAGHNSHTLGIENEGDYAVVRPPERLLAALVDTLVWLCEVYALDPHAAIVGHRDYNTTSCPGDRLYGELPRMRRAVAERLWSSAR